jgi:hypothetical protein
MEQHLIKVPVDTCWVVCNIFSCWTMLDRWSKLTSRHRAALSHRVSATALSKWKHGHIEKEQLLCKCCLLILSFLFLWGGVSKWALQVLWAWRAWQSCHGNLHFVAFMWMIPLLVCCKHNKVPHQTGVRYGRTASCQHIMQDRSDPWLVWCSIDLYNLH